MGHCASGYADHMDPSPKADDSVFGFDSGWADDGSSGVVEVAYHADVAAKHAASTASHATILAQWVQHLWGKHEELQCKVKELEDWKKRTLEDMRKLREEHKQLRKRFGGPSDADDAVPGVKKAVTAPSMSTGSGDGFSGPPGLDKPAVATTPSGDGEDDESPPSCEGGEKGLKENDGVTVKEALVDDLTCERAEWRIGSLSVKLRGCMGRALVSPPFSAWGMEDLRLMIYPDQKESSTGPRSRRQKDLYNKKVSDGPLDGCLKLKVPNCPPPHVLKYYLTVGSPETRKGPFEHNFSECTVSDPAEFALDWLTQVDADGGLSVSVDIMKMADPDASGTPAC